MSPRALGYAAALAKYSAHPVSRALHPFTGEYRATNVTEIPGQGLQGEIGGASVKFGSTAFVALRDSADSLGSSWLQIDDAPPIRFEFEDAPRPDALATISQVKSQGLSLELLSGDQKSIAKEIALELGIDRWHGDVNPKQKLTLLHKRQSENLFPLMVGDGINDAPALAAANSSAAPATAADVARSAADIILQGDKLSGLPFAIKTARQAQSRVAENLSLAIIYNLIAIPLAIFGFVNPLIAALAMSGSSLLVTLNALRMTRS